MDFLIAPGLSLLRPQWLVIKFTGLKLVVGVVIVSHRFRSTVFLQPFTHKSKDIRPVSSEVIKMTEPN